MPGGRSSYIAGSFLAVAAAVAAASVHLYRNCPSYI